MPSEMHTPLWRTRGGIVLLGFLAVAGFYLLTEHTAFLDGLDGIEDRMPGVEAMLGKLDAYLATIDAPRAG